MEKKKQKLIPRIQNSTSKTSSRKNKITGFWNIVDKANNYDDDGDIEKEVLSRVNNSSANFVQRLKNTNRKFIPDWCTNGKMIATHKLSVGTDAEGNNYIYPEIQEINGRLIDFTRPPYAPFMGRVAAEERGDTVRVPNLEDAIRFTYNYKQYYPGFNKY